MSLAKHPQALGKPSSEVWAEIWDICGPLVKRVFRDGEASFRNDVRFLMNRGDFIEETFYSFSYSPIRESGDVVAVTDAFNDERFDREHLRRHNIRSVLVAPLITRNQPFGLIFFNYHLVPHSFTEAELAFARQLAASATIALENARLFDEIRRAEAQLLEAKAANRGKDQFLAALSHELRTPLTPVLIAAESLREDARLPFAVREQLGMIERNITLEARLIDDLFDITAVTQGKLYLRAEPCDAHALIELANEIVRDSATTKGITIECDLGANNVVCWLTRRAFSR